MVELVDLRTASARYPDVAGGVLVIDDADSLVDHAPTYEAFINAKRVSGVVCLVLGEDPSASAEAAVLSVPFVLRYATVLWVGDVRGVRWSSRVDAVDPVRGHEPETFSQLIEVLRVPEIFDRVRLIAGDLHGLVAGPGLIAVSGGAESLELAEARSTAIDQLTRPFDGKPPGADALSTVLRAGGAADPTPAQILGTSPLGQAAANSVRALDRVDSLARVLGTWRAVVGRDRSTEFLGTEVRAAGVAAENYRLGLVTLLDRIDGHLLVNDPTKDAVIELGVPAPVEARPVEATAGLRDFVAARLGGGASLPGLATELREAANRAAPQGCATVLERIRSEPPLGLDMPRFRRFPLSLWTLVLAFLTCGVVGFALGPGWPGMLAAGVLALVWGGLGWLLLARRPDAEAELGLRAAAPRALPIYLLPAVAGAAVGILAATYVPLASWPTPVRLWLYVAVSVLIAVVAPVLCWMTAVRRWRRALAADDLRQTVAQLADAADQVIKREWQLVERRRAVALALEVTAAGLEEIAAGLRADGDGLFVPHSSNVDSDVPVGLARAVRPELIDVVHADLADIALQALAQSWIAAESGRRAAAGVHYRTLERLMGEYATHVGEQGLITPRTTEDGRRELNPEPRNRLVARIWSESPDARAALAAGAEDPMIQLCTDEQLGFLSSTTAPASLRFAPRQLRRVLEHDGTESGLLADSGVVWSAGRELIGTMRLIPVRIDSVLEKHPGGQE